MITLVSNPKQHLPKHIQQSVHTCIHKMLKKIIFLSLNTYHLELQITIVFTNLAVVALTSTRCNFIQILSIFHPNCIWIRSRYNLDRRTWTALKTTMLLFTVTGYIRDIIKHIIKVRVLKMKFLMSITVFLIFLFNGRVNGQSLSEFKTQVAEQLTEAFDRIILLEKGSAKEIKELKSKDLNNTEEIQFLTQQVEDLKKHVAQETEIRIRHTEQIELLKEQVEDLRKITAPESCAQLMKQGATRGQDVYLDSDGVNHGKKGKIFLCHVCQNDVFFTAGR